MSDTSKSTTPEPTKRPWTCDPQSSGIWAEEEIPIAYFSWEDHNDETQWLDNHKANGPRIVKCVNMHDRLVATLEKCRPFMHDEMQREIESALEDPTP